MNPQGLIWYTNGFKKKKQTEGKVIKSGDHSEIETLYYISKEIGLNHRMYLY